MPKPITTDEAQRLLGAGAQFVEVLPRSEYDEEHVSGAVHIPLRHLEEQAADILDPARPVVVYCWDYQ